MLSRRNFVKTSTAGLLGLGLTPTLSSLHSGEAAGGTAKPTAHFIFLRHSNGMFPSFLSPASLSETDKKKEEAKQALDLDLNKLELQEWMAELNPYKSNLTLLQGLSARMCTMGHATFQSPLAVCKAAERVSTIARASIDVVLGRMFKAPFDHIELCCTDERGIVRGKSSIGPGQPNFAFASPKPAFESLFRVGSKDKETLAALQQDEKMYEFLSGRVGRQDELVRSVDGGDKIGNYLSFLSSIQGRNGEMRGMSDRIRKFTPTLSGAAMEDECTTVEKQDAYADIILGAMGAGLCNSITMTLDILTTKVTGILGDRIDLHDVGHGRGVGGLDALEVRSKIREQHVKVIAKIIKGLKGIPEGNGNMFDNTVIMYFPENGEVHHSSGIEQPFVILAGNNTKVNFQGRYIRLPFYDEPGHRTIGNLYTTLINNYGSPIKHYGDFDLKLKVDQTGPIRQFVT